MQGNSPDEEYDDPHAQCTHEIHKLRMALEAIANDPHCAYTDGIFVSDHDSGYKMGIADGHRCAANKAREALSGK